MRRTRPQDDWGCCHAQHVAGFPCYIIQCTYVSYRQLLLKKITVRKLETYN